MKELITNHKTLIITAAAALAVAGGTGAVIMSAQQPTIKRSTDTTAQPVAPAAIDPMAAPTTDAPATGTTTPATDPATATPAPADSQTSAQPASPAPAAQTPAPAPAPQPVIMHNPMPPHDAPLTLNGKPAPTPGGGTASSDGASSAGSN